MPVRRSLSTRPLLADRRRRASLLSPNRALTNAMGAGARKARDQFSALNIYWPLPYGEVMLGGRILAWAVSGTDLILSVGWCAGGHHGIEEIVQIYNNDKILPSEVTVTNYLGTTTQTPNATLASAFPNYKDANVIAQHGAEMGIAYSVLVFPKESIDRFPDLTARIKGLKTNAGAYSDSPTYAIADFISSPLYGQGKTVTAASITANAAWTDVVLAGNVKRFIISLVLDQPRKCEEWVEVLRNYAACFVVPEGDSVKLIPNRSGSSVRTLTDADVVQGSFLCSKKSISDTPTVVAVQYTDRNKVPWRELFAIEALDGVEEGLVPYRISNVSLPGCPTYNQALRMAATRLNEHNLVDFSCEWDSYDNQMDLEIGDIITISNSLGVTSKVVRVKTIEPGEYPGMYHISASEHDNAIYSNKVVERGSEPDGSLPSPADPPAPIVFSVVEEVVTDQAKRTGSHLVVTWTGVTWPFAAFYQVRIADFKFPIVNTVVHLGPEEHQATSGLVSEGIQYTIQIRTISTTGHLSQPAILTITPAGRFLPPPNVTGLTAFEAGQFVSMTWNRVVDIGIVNYQIRRGTTSSTWETATVPKGGALVGGTSFLDRAVPAGTYRYFVKAIDDVGLESATANSTVVTVTADDSVTVIVNEFTGAAATAVNMRVYGVPGDGYYAVTDDGRDWNARFGGGVAADTWVDAAGDTWVDAASDTWTTSTAAGAALWDDNFWFHGHSLSPGDAHVTTEEWDIGVDRNGRWAFGVDVVLLGAGAAYSEKVHSASAADYPTFTVDDGAAASVLARYMKAQILDDGGAPGRGICVKFPVQAQVFSKLISQFGEATVPATPQPLTVTFSQPYAGIPRIRFFPKGSVARVFSAENLTAIDFELYSFSVAGTQVEGTCTWEAEGT